VPIDRKAQTREIKWPEATRECGVGVVPSRRKFLEFSSKNAAFYAFYCEKNCGQKPGWGLIDSLGTEM